MVTLVATLLCLLGRATGYDLPPSSSDEEQLLPPERHSTHVDDNHEPRRVRVIDDDTEENEGEHEHDGHGDEEDSGRRRAKRGKVDKETVQMMLSNKLKSKPKPRADMPVECQQLWMTRTDMHGFVQMLKAQKIDEYLEYGGGGSTLCASRLVRHVTTIEHNHDWCVALEKQLNETGVTNVNLICHPVDWQSPGFTEQMDGYYRDFQMYVDTVHTLGIEKFGFVFIDGRARAACAKAVWRYLDNDSIMAIHDWKRTHYHDQVLAIYDRVDTPFALKELAVMKKKMVPPSTADLQQKVP